MLHHHESPMDYQRLLPYGLGLLSASLGSLARVDYGQVAGAILGVGGAAVAVWWKLEQNKLAVKEKEIELARLQKAAELQHQKDMDASRIEAYQATEKAKLEAYQANERAKIEIQKEVDAVNRDSLSKQVDDQAKVMVALKAEIQERKERAHEDRKLSNGRIMELECRLMSLDQSHVPAINANGENADALARATGITLPNPTPHVEPIPLSGDDIPNPVH